MAGIENTVLIHFDKAMDKLARQRGLEVTPFPVNGQDRDAAGDAIFTIGMKLILIEFKSYEANLIDEVKKPRRKRLCELLPLDDDMRATHDLCHFAAWMGQDWRIELNIYRQEICNEIFFPGSGFESAPRDQDRFKVEQFAERFFDSSELGLGVEDFERYLAWVMIQTSGSSRSTVQVQALDDSEGLFRTKPFASIGEAYKWVAQRPKNDLETKNPWDI